VDTTADRDAVEAATRALFTALSTGSLAWVDEHLLSEPDAVHIGSGRGAWMAPERLRRELGAQAEDLRADWVIEDLVVQLRADVAWVAVRPVVRFDDGSELEYRATLVFVVEGSAWCLAHSHLSVGI
jgi:hypothetical protein